LPSLSALLQRWLARRTIKAYFRRSLYNFVRNRAKNGLDEEAL